MGIEDNLRTLDIERLTAVNLRLLDDAPVDERFVDQLGALIAAHDEGLIAGIGISNVTHQHLLRALEVTDIVCVQNAYNLADRSSQPVLDECRTHGIAFVPFCPLGGSRREHQAIRANPVVTEIAAGHDATPAQVALAWLLAIADNVLLIPGTSSRSHLAENIAAGSLSLRTTKSPASPQHSKHQIRARRPHQKVATMTDISIETPNGSIDAVLEIPSGKGPWPGVVVIHDAFGLREPHRAIARQIADNGYLAIAPNLFARGGVIRCMRAVMSDLIAFEGQAFEDVTAARQLLSKSIRLYRRDRRRGVLHGRRVRARRLHEGLRRIRTLLSSAPTE